MKRRREEPAGSLGDSLRLLIGNLADSPRVVDAVGRYLERVLEPAPPKRGRGGGRRKKAAPTLILKEGADGTHVVPPEELRKVSP